jgi:hypothetical protein
VDRCGTPTDCSGGPAIFRGGWPCGVGGKASRDRACRVSVGRDKRTGKYVVRWRSGDRHHSKSFTYQRDAERWDREQKRSRELGVSLDPFRGSETLAEVVEGWWKAHVVTLEETRETRIESSGRDTFTRRSGESRFAHSLLVESMRSGSPWKTPAWVRPPWRRRSRLSPVFVDSRWCGD